MCKPSPFYTSLTYEEYKEFEEQLKRYPELETTHKSAEGYYHRSFRMKIGGMMLEVHGPLVKAGEPNFVQEKLNEMLA